MILPSISDRIAYTQRGTLGAIGKSVSRTLLIGRRNRLGFSYPGLDYSLQAPDFGLRSPFPRFWTLVASGQLRLGGLCLLKRHNCELRPAALRCLDCFNQLDHQRFAAVGTLIVNHQLHTLLFENFSPGIGRGKFA